VLVRLTPLGPAIVSYLVGAAGVRFGGFMLACLAMIPAFLVETYFGHAGVHVASMAGRPGGGLTSVTALMLGGLVVVLVVMAVVGRAARRAIQQVAPRSNAVAGP
jgi:uncharacterized membrane protein YdjX (TVP38/TMEM64 family)